MGVRWVVADSLIEVVDDRSSALDIRLRTQRKLAKDMDIISRRASQDDRPAVRTVCGVEALGYMHAIIIFEDYKIIMGELSPVYSPVYSLSHPTLEVEQPNQEQIFAC